MDSYAGYTIYSEPFIFAYLNFTSHYKPPQSYIVQLYFWNSEQQFHFWLDDLCVNKSLSGGIWNQLTWFQNFLSFPFPLLSITLSSSILSLSWQSTSVAWNEDTVWLPGWPQGLVPAHMFLQMEVPQSDPMAGKKICKFSQGKAGVKFQINVQN